MRPYSEDLRERAVQRAEAGETIRSIGEALRISPSCVSKWRKRLRETGSLTPDQIGGHKPRTLGPAWATSRCAKPMLWAMETARPLASSGSARRSRRTSPQSQPCLACRTECHRSAAWVRTTSSRPGADRQSRLWFGCRSRQPNSPALAGGPGNGRYCGATGAARRRRAIRHRTQAPAGSARATNRLNRAGRRTNAGPAREPTCP